MEVDQLLFATPSASASNLVGLSPELTNMRPLAALFTSERAPREYLRCFRHGYNLPIRTGMSKTNYTIMSETIYLIELSFDYTY